MQIVRYDILHKSVGMQEVMNSDIGTVQIELDFTGTPYESWTKMLDLRMSDSTEDQQNLGEDPIVTFTLTDEHTKQGELIVNAFVQDIDGNRKGFELQTIEIGEQLMVLSITATQQGNFKVTPEGGYAIKLVNRTGAISVKGYAVTPSDVYDNAVKKIVVDVPNPIGIVYESGVADGSTMWVVVAGIAEVYFANTPIRGHLARGFVASDVGYVSGQLKSEAFPTSPFATDKHFFEIGHVLETKAVPGLAKTVLHFN